MKELARFYDASEAEIAAAFLRSHGIEAVLPDGHTLAAMPNLRVGLGGIRLLVQDEDAYRAEQLLASVENAKPARAPRCPNCNSSSSRRVRDPKLPFFLLIFQEIFPFASATKYRRCNACGTKWEA